MDFYRNYDVINEIIDLSVQVMVDNGWTEVPFLSSS